ncbi:hypothetical protein NHH73_23180 [Oxalobacteraceae bacterium OTU3CINTB1]|nr:hypothetical protein NHH73_23180 [Oxalobacteraceae bacterium OTU3CINTB1]
MDNVHEVLERAWGAHSAGEFDAALKDYIWLFDATSVRDTEVAPLRLSYVLSAWAKLAEEHLPARQALVELRQRLTDRLLADGGDAILFNDIRAINDKLGDLQNTWLLFKQLPAELAAECANSALTSMMACGDYPLARSYLPEPEKHLAAYAGEVNAHVAQLQLLTDEGMSDLLATVYNYMAEVRLLLELLAGCGEVDAAEAMRRNAVDMIVSPEARACVEAEFATPGTTLDAMVELQSSTVA